MSFSLGKARKVSDITQALVRGRRGDQKQMFMKFCYWVKWAFLGGGV